MPTYTKFECGSEDILKAVHDFATHTFKAAFTNSAPNHATNQGLADITEITAGHGYVAGGVTLDNVTMTRTGGTTKITIDDEVFTAAATGSVGPFRYVVLYNATSTGNRLLGSYDYGGPLTLQAEENITLDFDATAGVITLT